MRLLTFSVLFLGLGTALAQAATLEPNYASDTVTIQADSQVSASCGTNFFKFDRSVVKSGGTVEPFTLPPKKVLVVTSFDWWASGNAGFANHSRTAWLFRTAGVALTVLPLKAPASPIPMGEQEHQRLFQPELCCGIREHCASKWMQRLQASRL